MIHQQSRILQAKNVYAWPSTRVHQFPCSRLFTIKPTFLLVVRLSMIMMWAKYFFIEPHLTPLMAVDFDTLDRISSF